MKPNSKKLSEDDAAICVRLATIRKAMGIDQSTLAGVLGISRDRVASYESLRVPVRFPVADAACRCFDVNQRWLALGKLPMYGYVPVPAELRSQLADRVLFLDAFNRVLGGYITRKLESDASIAGCKIDELDEHPIPSSSLVYSEVSKHLESSALHAPDLLRDATVQSIRLAFDPLTPKQKYDLYRRIRVLIATAAVDFVRQSTGAAVQCAGSPTDNFTSKSART